MSDFPSTCKDLESATSKYSQNFKNQEEQKVHMLQCHKCSTPQLFVTAVEGPVGQDCTLTVQTVAIKPPVSDCVQYQSCSLEAVTSTRARALCSCIAGQTLQKGHIIFNIAIPMDRFLHCSCADPRTAQQVKDICGQQSCHHPTRHLSQLGDMPSQFNAVDLLYLT